MFVKREYETCVYMYMCVCIFVFHVSMGDMFADMAEPLSLKYAVELHVLSARTLSVMG
jgi:hypothetical protein